MPVKAVVFDAYGTLFDPYSTAAACEAAFPDRGQELTRLWRDKQLQYTWLRALMGRYIDFWQVTGDALDVAARQLGLELDAAAHARILGTYNSLAPYAEAAEALQLLQARGVKTAIFSNGAPDMLRAVTSHGGLGAHLDAILSVDPAHTYKVHPDSYALVLPALGVSKDEVLFVSSNSWDINGAGSFGFATAWINRSGAVPEALGFPARHVLTRLTELPALLA